MISPSELNLFFQCPFKWKLQQDQQQTIETDKRYLQLGTLIHNIIATYFKQIGPSPTLAMIEKTVKGLYETDWDNSLHTLKQRADRCITNFIKFEKKRRKEWLTFHTPNDIIEKRYPIGNTSVIVDYYSPENEILIDWKTGRQNRITLDLQRQGKIYEMVLRTHGYKIKKILFVMLFSGMVLEMPAVSDEWLNSQLNQMKDMIQHERFPKKEGPLCSWCEYLLRCTTDNICLWTL